jgi:competence ComEA-like helix-hairpin-helix protein
MKKTILFGAASVLLWFTGAAMAQNGASAVDKRQAVFQKICTTCHSMDNVGARRTRSQWEDLIYKMIDLGAKGSDQEFRTILDYLASEHGRVNVNRGSASELSAVLGLTAQQASVIVSHRREHGKYENFEDFAKATGLDAAKLEDLRDAMTY